MRYWTSPYSTTHLLNWLFVCHCCFFFFFRFYMRPFNSGLSHNLGSSHLVIPTPTTISCSMLEHAGCLSGLTSWLHQWPCWWRCLQCWVTLTKEQRVSPCPTLFRYSQALHMLYCAFSKNKERNFKNELIHFCRAAGSCSWQVCYSLWCEQRQRSRQDLTLWNDCLNTLK